jgi:hypothetical protein
MPFALASEEETIYSGTVTGSEIIEAEGYTFEVKVAGNVGALINHNNHSFIVKQSQCSQDGKLKFCAGTTAYAYRNSTTWADVYSISITVTEKSGFEINKTIEKRKLLIGEKTSVKIQLINDGVSELKNILFTDAYPYEFEVGNAEGCTLQYNIVQWRGAIGPGSQHKCTYTLLGLESTENKSEARVEYTEGTERKTAASERIIIRVQNHSLKVTPTINITKTGINGSIDVSLIIENIYTGDIKVTSFDITIPKSFEILRNSGEISSRGQGFFWEGNLEREQQKNFNFTLSPKMSGNFTLDITERYTVASFDRDIKEKISLAVSCDCIQIQHKVTYDDGQPYLTVNLFNPSYEIKYTELVISTNLISASPTTIAPRENLLLFKGPVTEGNTYNITLDYDSQYEQHFTDHKTIQTTEEPVVQEPIPQEVPEPASNDSEMIPEQTQENESSTPKQADNTKNRALIVFAVALILGVGIFILLKRRH